MTASIVSRAAGRLPAASDSPGAPDVLRCLPDRHHRMHGLTTLNASKCDSLSHFGISGRCHQVASAMAEWLRRSGPSSTVWLFCDSRLPSALAGAVRLVVCRSLGTPIAYVLFRDRCSSSADAPALALLLPSRRLFRPVFHVLTDNPTVSSSSWLGTSLAYVGGPACGASRLRRLPAAR